MPTTQVHREPHWWEVCIIHSDSLSEAIACFLFDAGASAIQHEESTPTTGMLTRAGFHSDLNHEVIKADLDQFLYNLVDIFSLREVPKAQWSLIGAGDWAEKWKQGLAPIEIGDTLVIRPSWVSYSPRADQVMVILDPGMAFGTGRHASTYMCLQAIEQILTANPPPNLRILDIGTGSGILAIACAALGQRQILGIDLDPEVLPIAEENLALNGFSDRVNFSCDEPSAIQGHFDLILANLTAMDLLGLTSEFRRLAAPSATVVLSGILDEQAPAVTQAYQTSGFALLQRRQQDEWVSLTLQQSGEL